MLAKRQFPTRQESSYRTLPEELSNCYSFHQFFTVRRLSMKQCNLLFSSVLADAAPRPATLERVFTEGH